MNESTEPTGTTGKWTPELMAAHEARLEFMTAMGQGHYSRTDAQWHVARYAKTVGEGLEAEVKALSSKLETAYAEQDQAAKLILSINAEHAKTVLFLNDALLQLEEAKNRMRDTHKFLADGFAKHGFILHPGLTPEQNAAEWRADSERLLRELSGLARKAMECLDDDLEERPMRHGIGPLHRQLEVLLDVIEPEHKREWLPHVIEEGSREHVLSWDTKGTHCSEPKCEINKGYALKRNCVAGCICKKDGGRCTPERTCTRCGCIKQTDFLEHE